MCGLWGRLVCINPRGSKAPESKVSETQKISIICTVHCSNDVFLVLSFVLHLLAGITLFKKQISPLDIF